MEISDFDDGPHSRTPRPIEQMRADLEDLGRRIADAQAGRWPKPAPPKERDTLAPFTADWQ